MRVMGSPASLTSLQQIMDLKVTEVQHQLPHQCHQGLIDLEILSICAIANGPTGNLEAI